MHRSFTKGDKVLFSSNSYPNLIGVVVRSSSRGVEINSFVDGQEKTFLVPVENVVLDVPGSHQLDVENMILLSDLSPITILKNLRNRYTNSQIYTYIGNIVITVNPYKDLLIDGPEIMQQYFNRVISTAPPYVHLLFLNCFRHLYGLAETIYQAALHEQSDQVVVIR
ncbi:putative myosin XV [Fasciola gigantica]|uniref:Putative myosin XV n=1 Tax=Fasciola gigantica TaxID=46835 RepID=A0A504YYX6_FASGI|nr:putative myosin XV [Fasciola gigantica]